MRNIPDLNIGVTFTRCDKCEYKNSSTRDALLVTAGMRAAYMYYVGYIYMPRGVEDNAELSEFIATTVGAYLNSPPGTNFDEYIETALRNKYRKEI